MRYFGVVAIVPFVAAMAFAIAVVGAIVAAFARRGHRVAVADRVGVGRDRSAAWAGPARRVRVGRPRHRAHNLSPARALASFGGVPLVSFVTVAPAGFLLDVCSSRARARRVCSRWRPSVLVAVLLVTVLADVTRYEPTRDRAAARGHAPGRRPELSLSDQQQQLLTADHLALADQLRGHYDLIVFPEGALDTDPDLDPDLRAGSRRSHSSTASSILVNARTPAGNGKNYNSNIMYEPERHAGGHLLEAAPRPVRRVRPVA